MLFQKGRAAILVGCGRFGASLAGNLCELDYDVMIIDKDEESFEKLPESYSGYEVAADGADVNTLEKAGIQHAQLVVAATGYDGTNSLICQIAARIYHVPDVYIRLTDPNLEALIQGYGIQAIYPFKLSMKEFERLSGIEIGESV